MTVVAVSLKRDVVNHITVEDEPFQKNRLSDTITMGFLRCLKQSGARGMTCSWISLLTSRGNLKVRSTISLFIVKDTLG